MIRKYYEVDIICTGEIDGERKFSRFDDETKIFETAYEVTEWLKKQYGSAKRSIMYHADSIPCGYVYKFENADWSHSPVEHWQQEDWVNISRIEAETVFEEIAYEVPEADNC
jgi:hypothetical protein